ncbi:hypothetical protein EDC18_103393 [Natranaerovirga pectinivora]|uniref:Uncharacterized protein n=1 Tax=Natranaerovirga pectinivora TaxID=682400 RepID=A0A4R3MLU9_9FIRM|nr:hypothetical protein [Natranaerovirga pectinivora]TCT15682.1 hypothetical protein EDC18_103393 [Natranaerovirga pectinivora]
MYKKDYLILLKSILICIPFLIFTFCWVAIIPLKPSLIGVLIIAILPTITSIGPSAIYLFKLADKKNLK